MLLRISTVYYVSCCLLIHPGSAVLKPSVEPRASLVPESARGAPSHALPSLGLELDFVDTALGLWRSLLMLHC